MPRFFLRFFSFVHFFSAFFFARYHGIGPTTMNSFADGSVTNTDTNDPKSNSTIQLQFSEPLSVRLRPTARDDSNNNGSHTFLALQPYELRKRSASTSSEQTTNGEEIRSRKFRTREQDPHDRQCVSLSETEEMSKSMRRTYQ